MTTRILLVVVVWLSFAKVGRSVFQPNTDEITLENIIPSAKVTERDLPKLTESNSEVLFKQGMEGYEVFRLPAIVFHQGIFLAFCEGRFGLADSSESNIVMKRGYLYGRRVTWDKAITVVANIYETRLANPVPLVDTGTDTVLVLYNVLPANITEDQILHQDHYNQKLHLIQSRDLGQTWSNPEDITCQTLGQLKPTPILFAPGPGHGIQMKSGRLIIQGNFYYRDTDPTHKRYRYHTSVNSVVFLSDNHGRQWRPGGYVPYGEDDKGKPIHSSEATIVELADNILCINSRTLEKWHPRSQSFSRDGGESFGEPELAETLIEPTGGVPGCMASMVGFQPWYPTNVTQNNSNRSYNGDPWVLFSNPADKLRRVKMSIRLNRDGCQTWSKPWTIWPLASGYSDMVHVKNTYDVDEGRHCPVFGIVYENGEVHSTSAVSFKMFTLTDVTNGIKSTDLKTQT